MIGRKLCALLPVVFFAASCSRDPQVQAKRYVENGNKFFDKAKYKEASIMYRRALQRDLRDGEAYYRLGLADIKLGTFADAVRALHRAVELEPKNSDAATKLADIYLVASSQDPSRAAPLLKEVGDLADKLLALDKSSPDGHRLKAQLAMVRNDPAGSVSEFAAARKSKPDDPDLALGYFQALSLNQQSGEAESVARELIAKNKTYAPIYDVLYAHYMRRSQPEQAEQALRQKIDANPKQSSYLVQLAGHYLYTKQTSQMDATLAKLSDEKQFPDGHMLAGDFLFYRARNFEAARAQYDAGSKAFPKERAMYQKRGVELLAAQGKSADATQLVTELLKENPKDPDAIAMRAALQVQSGDMNQINQAVNDLQSLVAKSPDNHLLHFNLARAYLAKNDADQARLQLESAIKIRPDFILARESLAAIYLSRGDSAKALKEADEIINLNRNDLLAHLVRLSALAAIGDRDKAREELNTINKLAPENPDAKYQIGLMAYQDKDYRRAESVFGDLYKSNPKDSRGLVGIVETMVSQNKMPDAVKTMESAIAREPERQDYKSELANLYVRDLKFDAAIQIFNDLLKPNPNSPDLLLRLAEAQRRKGDINTSIDTFKRASQASPGNAKALLELGVLLDGTGRRDQAKPIYEQVLKIEPDNAIALNNLAFIKAEEGTDLDEALTMAQRARQKMPNAYNIKDTLGWIYTKKNLSDDAVRTFKELTEEDPTNPSFHYHYGIALMQKGDRPSAKRELETAIRNNPSKDDAGKIRQLLSTI